MSAPRPFDAVEIGRLLRAGHMVKLGSVLLAVQGGSLLSRCTCDATATFAADDLLSGLGEVERFAAFITAHNHGVS